MSTSTNPSPKGSDVILLTPLLSLLNTEGQYMKESIFLVGNATNNQQYMKNSNSFVGNVNINQLERDPLLNTKGKFMKEQISLGAMQLSYI